MGTGTGRVIEVTALCQAEGDTEWAAEADSGKQ